MATTISASRMAYGSIIFLTLEMNTNFMNPVLFKIISYPFQPGPAHHLRRQGRYGQRSFALVCSEPEQLKNGITAPMHSSSAVHQS
jgi:hypothetical protein